MKINSDYNDSSFTAHTKIIQVDGEAIPVNILLQSNNYYLITPINVSYLYNNWVTDWEAVANKVVLVGNGDTSAQINKAICCWYASE